MDGRIFPFSKPTGMSNDQRRKTWPIAVSPRHSFPERFLIDQSVVVKGKFYLEKTVTPPPLTPICQDVDRLTEYFTRLKTSASYLWHAHGCPRSFPASPVSRLSSIVGSSPASRNQFSKYLEINVHISKQSFRLVPAVVAMIKLIHMIT